MQLLDHYQFIVYKLITALLVMIWFGFLITIMNTVSIDKISLLMLIVKGLHGIRHNIYPYKVIITYDHER